MHCCGGRHHKTVGEFTRALQEEVRTHYRRYSELSLEKPVSIVKLEDSPAELRYDAICGQDCWDAYVGLGLATSNQKDAHGALQIAYNADRIGV